MASRYIRNTAILAKIETTYLTDSVPVGGTNAILVSNVNIVPLNANNVSRDLIRNYFGGSEQLVGTNNISVTFDVELAASSALGTAPSWGPLLRAAGFAETLTASTRAEYSPISTAFESLTIYVYDDGVLHKLLGARGDVTIKMGLGERPMLSFSFIGVNGGISAVSVPSTTLTAWQRPLVINDTNTGDILLGCTYTTGTLGSGTAYPSRGIEIAVGNTVNHIPLLGGESVDITGREVTGSVQLDLTAAQEVTFMATVLANTTQSVGLTHGTAAPGTVVVYAPAVQIIVPTKEELNGKRLIGYQMRMVPSSGNDELKICVR